MVIINLIVNSNLKCKVGFHGHYDTESAPQHILASLLSGRLRTDFAGCCQNSPASSRMSRSVSGQPRQGSVMDLP